MLEAVRTSETSVHFYKTIQRHIPEGCHLVIMMMIFIMMIMIKTTIKLLQTADLTHRRENHKSYNIMFEFVSFVIKSVIK